MTTVAEEDPSRPPWPSSPSPGWVSGVDRLTALPNGLPLSPMSGATDSGVVNVEREAVALAAQANRAGGGSSNCTFVANMDSCQTCFNMSAPAADTPTTCCALCAAAGPAKCYSASFYLVRVDASASSTRGLPHVALR